ncbi:trypsin-like serine peptidase [Arthrobacter sp. NPDC058192]|uniref:trypsin-like serine peptidase n=1 Tax=Arthrobacter sp. NPDC058192 TaxID=3346372 RepID=UPI0036F0AC16
MSLDQEIPDEAVAMSTAPMTWQELRRRRRQDATEELPPELSALTDGHLPAKAIQVLDRTDLRTDISSERVRDVEAYRPPWVASAFVPNRSGRPEPPRIRHRGSDLTPLTIWQPESRTIYNDTSFPWGCVCRIVTARGAVGSGVLIGPRHVLTASHVVDWSTSDAERIEVHRHGGTVAATAFDTHAFAFTHITSVSYGTLDEDYAVLILDQRLGDRFGFMGCKQYNSSWDDDHVWWTIGYPTDIGTGLFPTFQRDQSLDEDEFDLGSGRAMTTSADAMKGQSGSPVFGWWDDLPFVVAVVSAEGQVVLSGLENWCSGGADLNRTIHKMRADFS